MVRTVQAVVHGVRGAVAVTLGHGTESLGVERPSVAVTLRGRVMLGAVREGHFGRIHHDAVEAGEGLALFRPLHGSVTVRGPADVAASVRVGTVLTHLHDSALDVREHLAQGLLYFVEVLRVVVRGIAADHFDIAHARVDFADGRHGLGEQVPVVVLDRFLVDAVEPTSTGAADRERHHVDPV